MKRDNTIYVVYAEPKSEPGYKWRRIVAICETENIAKTICINNQKVSDDLDLNAKFYYIDDELRRSVPITSSSISFRSLRKDNPNEPQS